MTAWAVLVAAGDGTRLAADVPKALVPLKGMTLVERCLAAIEASGAFSGIVLACGKAWLDEAESLVKQRFGSRGRAIAGGASRQESVRNALDRLGREAGAIVVHDAARPLAMPELFTRALNGLERAAGAVCAVRVTDTIKRTTGDVISGTLERGSLWRVQTPQAFRLDALLDAHAEATKDGFVGTDDATLLERHGQTVIVVPGDDRNLKITTPGDLAVAEALLETM